MPNGGQMPNWQTPYEQNPYGQMPMNPYQTPMMPSMPYRMPRRCIPYMPYRTPYRRQMGFYPGYDPFESSPNNGLIDKK